MNRRDPGDDMDCAPDMRGFPHRPLTDDEIEDTIREEQRALAERDPFLEALVREGLVTHWDNQVVRPEELPRNDFFPRAPFGPVSDSRKVAIYEAALAEIAKLIGTGNLAVEVVLKRTAIHVGKSAF